MKIISVDNFDRERPGYSDDELIAEGISNTEFAEVMVQALNARFSGEQSERFFKVVPDSYQLRVYGP